MPFPSAPLPPGEVLRQAALFASGVLSLRGNQRLRAIVDRVAELLDVPIVAISIVDRDRQWFPAIHGLEAEETDRDIAFCAYAILEPGETMVVPDATQDPRFAHNPLVTEAPHIRFYAGAPLVTREGAALGTLCAIDSKPHVGLPAEHEHQLRRLASEAMMEIERLDHIRAASPEAIVAIVDQIRAAANADDEELLIALDRVLQRVETAAQRG
ncbi:GAF domain-containing protein [Sphingomonas vulcanisoli]|nr:GAF domain-containing protein [Sphingomonas vulcanisoli]